MRLAISNIAWDISEDENIAALLQRYAIDAIDVAPGKYFPVPAQATDRDIARVRDEWATRGFEITGMQALLFGTTGLNVFGRPDSQRALLEHLGHICRIGAGLNATRLVFGSPKNRDRTGLDDAQALEIALPFFNRLGDIAHAAGVQICLEPNPVCYGANFMTNSAQTADVVRAVAHPAIGMQLDTGALTINSEEVLQVVQDYATLIRHIHASEPQLLPLGDGATEHRKVAQALEQNLAQQVVTIEMLATENEPHLVSVERAVQTAVRFYRSHGRGSQL